jgi:uncharacterized protein DUF6610/ParB-like nuclease family protein
MKINESLAALAVPINELHEDPANVRTHPDRNLATIEASLRQFGQQKPIVALTTGRVIAGNGTLRAARNVGAKHIAVVRFDEEDDARAAAYALVDNRSSDLSEWDFPSLTAQLDMLNAGGIDMAGLGFTDDELEQLMHVGVEQRLVRGRMPKRRAVPLDLIFCAKLGITRNVLALDAGWKLGCQSGVEDVGRTKAVMELLRSEIVFVDNDFKDYDHRVHRDFVEAFRPKYATVRDLMTVQQCRDAGIAYHDFDTVMAWAAELRAYTDHVIVIPKYDCLDRIPDDYVLGYSVVSSYGGTPLPPERFAGRKVHLLGGTWMDQLGLLAVLGDDVVSLDHNLLATSANYGAYYFPDGQQGRIPQDPVPGDPLSTARNRLLLCLAISLGNIASSVIDLYSQEPAPEPDTEEPAWSR